MATKVAVRYLSRRFSSGAFSSGARKGQKAEYTSASSGGAYAKASDSTASTFSTAGIITDKNRNFAVVAGVVTGLGAVGWHLNSMNRVHRLHLEALSTVIELNNNQRSYLFCSEVHVGRDGTIKQFSLIPRGIGPAGPNENLTEIAKKGKTDEPATENGEANDLRLVTLQGKTAGVSTDKNSYFAGVVAGLGGLGWYLVMYRVAEEIVSTILELNNNTVIELSDKGSGSFCSYVRVGPDGTTMRWKILRP